MPTGQFTAADLQQAAPPPTGQFTMADIDAPSKNITDYASDFGKHFATGMENLAAPFLKASAPNVALQLWRHLHGQPNELKDVPENAMQAFLMSGGFGEEIPPGSKAAGAPEATVPAKTADVLEHPGLKPWVNAAKAEIMKIPGANLLKTAIDSAKGFAESTPEAPAAPTPVVPQTNGVPWGAKIPEAAAAPQPAAITLTEAPVSATAAESIPRTLSGESALRQILTGQDNANLLKIARSRGISVSTESQLKPGVADNRIINKIIDDFSDDELDNIRSTYLQNQSKHQFGDVGPEAWKTMSLQTYFPDVKIPTATLKRTASAINKPAMTPPAGYKPTATAASDDLTGILQDSLKKARELKELR
jgi:hypothetical protein